jgi:hypothetical protein
MFDSNTNTAAPEPRAKDKVTGSRNRHRNPCSSKILHGLASAHLRVSTSASPALARRLQMERFLVLAPTIVGGRDTALSRVRPIANVQQRKALVPCWQCRMISTVLLLVGILLAMS